MEPRVATQLWFPAAHQVELRAVPLDAPGSGEVIVRSTVSLISSGTEPRVLRGETPVGSPMNQMSRGDYGFPISYGYQVVGTVLETGPGAEHLAGTRVFARHPHHDLFLIPAAGDLVKALPGDIPDEAAVFANLMEVAVTALLDVPVRPGDVVAVIGHGVVGELIARLARRACGRLVVVEPHDARRRRAQEHGADAAVAPDAARAAVLDLSSGRGADVVFEVSGAGSALQLAVELAGQEAELGVVSNYGSTPVEVRLSPEFHWGRLHIHSSQIGTVGGGLQPRWDKDRRISTALEILAGLDHLPPVRRFPFSSAADAYRALLSGEATGVTLMLDYGGMP